MIVPLTTSELAFEAWCRAQGVIYRRIREARAPGHKCPDYAVRLQPYWCFIEIKELDDAPEDAALTGEVQAGVAGFRWLDPGARLRRPIRAASAQLRKASKRGFPTVVCLFDKTIGFHLERVHVLQAMFGRETLHFEVSNDPAHEPRLLGTRYGKKAALTRQDNTSISAVAVMRQPSGSALVIDLYHNPHARVSIPPTLAAPLVRKQYAKGLDDPDRQEPNVLDLMQTAEGKEWLEDPNEKFEREVEACLREFRAAQAP
jgi:hypothetical protein